MNRYMIRMLALFFCSALLLSLTACTPTEDVGTTGEGSTAVTTAGEPITKEMRSTLLRLCEEYGARGSSTCASAEYREEFQALRREILSKVSTMTAAEYETYYAALTALGESFSYAKGSLPRIYLDTEGGRAIDDTYIVTSVIIADKEGGREATVEIPEAKAKTRGNSTKEPEVDKRSYKLKFEESQTVLSLGKSKSWNLISLAFDKTLIRNSLAYEFARELGLNVPDCAFVDVYLNGTYMGVYLLTEPTNVGKTKVDIDLKNGDFLLELEQNPRKDDECAYVRTALYGTRFCVKEPEKAELKSGQKKQIEAFLNRAEEALCTADPDEISEYFDVDSFIDFYIVSELFKNLDIAYSSTYFYVKDGKIYAGPVWDFDLSAGNVSTDSSNPKYMTYNNIRGYGTNTGNSYEGLWVARIYGDMEGETGNPTHYFYLDHATEEDEVVWMSELLYVKEFRDQMIARYMELQEKICNLYEDNDLGKNRIDTLVESLGDAVVRNYTETDTTRPSWQVNVPCFKYEGEAYATYEENVEALRTWLHDRNTWLSEKWTVLAALE